MDFSEFVKKDLNYIKENLNLEILQTKTNYGNTILNYLFLYFKSLETIKYVFDFTKCNYPSLFLEKHYDGYTILNYLFWYNRDLETIKYVLDFTKLNCPSLFLEKVDYGRTILFCHRDSESTVKYFFNFTKNNYPEIINDKIVKNYYSKKSLILPLTFQIQN